MLKLYLVALEELALVHGVVSLITARKSKINTNYEHLLLICIRKANTLSPVVLVNYAS